MAIHTHKILLFLIVIFFNNGFAAPSGNNVVEADPFFTDAPNYNYTLCELSPCIDAGNNSEAPTIDFDGNPRPFNSIVDI